MTFLGIYTGKIMMIARWKASDSAEPTTQHQGPTDFLATASNHHCVDEVSVLVLLADSLLPGEKLVCLLKLRPT